MAHSHIDMNAERVESVIVFKKVLVVLTPE
jgi:hypothetical protein